MRSSPRSSSGRSQASRTTRAPGSWPPRSIARSTACAGRTLLDAQARGARSRDRGARRRRPSPTSMPHSTTTSATTSCSLVFTACHPVLSTEARVALTLRLVGGLTTDEIARAFLVPEATVAQRIVRAKRTLAEASVPFEVPRGPELAARLASVLEVVYLIFNEGYSATGGEDWMRPALCEEALRLGRVLAELDAGRARGSRPRRADGDPGLAAAGASRARRGAHSSARSGPWPLGSRS